MKARRMAGLGPITEQDICFQMDKTKDYSRAKKWAVKAHLAHYYRYSQDELDTLELLETKRALKDNIIYIAVSSERDIKDIYARKAEMRCDKTVVRSYIPPQFYTRFAAINKICARKRAEDDSLKTQVRFGERDLHIMTKLKGSQDPYFNEDMETFLEGERLPEIDLTIKWRFQEDRPPRRRVASPSPPSSPDHPTSRQKTHSGTSSPLTTRQLSQEQQEKDQTLSKRRKLTNLDTELPANQKDADMDITQ